MERKRGHAFSLFGNFDQLAAGYRNISHWTLTNAGAKYVFGETWAKEARRIVALFRAAYDLFPGDAAFAGLVERVRASSPDFDGWWSGHPIAAPVSGTKQLRHSTHGLIS